MNSNFQVMYESNSSSNYLVLKFDPDVSLNDYQTNMLLNNRINGLLEFNINYAGNHMNCFYNITSKCTLAGFLSRKRFSRNELLITLRSVINNICCLNNFLLYDGSLLLDENYIFVEPENIEVYFVYLPLSNVKNDVKAFFQKLIVELVKFKDEKSDNYVQKILGAIKSELFSLQSFKTLIESLLGEEIRNDREMDGEKGEKTVPDKAIQEKSIPDKSKPKPALIKGNIRIPEISANSREKEKTDKKRAEVQNSRTDKNIAKSASRTKISKSVLAVLLLQPVFAAAFIFCAASDFIKSQGDSAAAKVLLPGIFISMDILVCRIMKERMGAAKTVEPSGEPSGALQYILDRMRDKKSVNGPETAFPSHDKEGGEIYPSTEACTYGGETVLIKRNKAKGVPCLKEKGGEELIELDGKSLIVGRMESFVDYTLKSSAIGKIHAELTEENGEIYLMDCNSRNGTYINDNRLIPNTRQKITHCDIVRFANTEFIFYDSGLLQEV